MTFVTLTVNGVEKAFGDLGISTARGEWKNQTSDNLGFDIVNLPADADDPYPYGTQIIVKIGRQAAVDPKSGLPIAGNKNFTGGKTFFVGWRVERFRALQPALEKFDYKFSGPWEFFFERIVFQKAFVTYNGVASIVDYRDQVVLGMSLQPIYGPGDTVAGTASTNLMSIRQQLIEIVQYVVAATTTAYGAPQIQFDTLTSAVDGTNYDLLAQTVAQLEANGFGCLIPDFLPGFVPGGNQTQGTLANMNNVLRAPLDAVNGVTCADAMRNQLRYLGLGNPVTWFDYTQTPPKLMISTRDQLAPKSLPFTGQSESFRIKRRDDLIPEAVALRFRIIGGASPPQIINDIATTIGGNLVEGVGLVGLLQTPAQFAAHPSSPNTINLDTGAGSVGAGTIAAVQLAARGFASQAKTIDMEGPQSIAATIACVPVDVGDPSTDGAALTFWTSVFPELQSVTGLGLFDASGAPATVKDDSDTDIDLSTYQYRLTDGQIAPWMNNGGSGGLTKQATISVKFKYTENANDAGIGMTAAAAKTVAYHLKTAKVTLTNLAGGTYGQTVAGEQVPYGLAGFLYAIESIPLYEGTFSIVEQEITDQVPPGNNLNIVGGRAEWATMDACVQAVSYDLIAAKTTVTFGPAGHLGAKDFMERIRANVGPRWYYQIGGNLINSSQGGGQLGSNIPKHGPSPANAVLSTNVMPTSVSDWLGHITAYAGGVPGINHDALGTTNFGGLGAPGAAQTHMAAGSGGTISSFYHCAATGDLILQINGSPAVTIQLKVSDLPSGFKTNSSGNYVIEMRELAVCNSDGTTSYIQLLCSKKYSTSLGNSP